MENHRWLQRATGVALMLIMFTACAFGQTRPGRRWKKAWVLSALALTASSFLDGQSSTGRNELNPLLRNSRGQFSSGRAIALKGGAAGSVLLVQSLFIHRKGGASLEKPCTFMNLAGAGIFSAIGVRNLSVKTQ